MNDDLASGFRHVDRAADFGAYSACLELIHSLPFFDACKRESFERIGASPGRRLLDVGCGLGDDAAAMAALVAPGGSVVGIDGSRAMIEAARARHGSLAGLTFEVADAAALPFDDASFDACRIDRVLQHIADPAPAVREMARVLRPGGLLVAYDNDWETLTIDSPDRATTRTLANAWCDRFPSGWIGRRLVPLFLEAGLREVEASPRTLVLRDLDTADRLYCLSATIGRLAEAGTIGREAAERWSEGLRAADREGRLFSSLTGFLAVGIRP
ncbi:MAG: methyltransferase domain-containing protein [Isosphaeraceae bacterium]